MTPKQWYSAPPIPGRPAPPIFLPPLARIFREAYAANWGVVQPCPARSPNPEATTSDALASPGQVAGCDAGHPESASGLYLQVHVDANGVVAPQMPGQRPHRPSPYDIDLAAAVIAEGQCISPRVVRSTDDRSHRRHVHRVSVGIDGCCADACIEHVIHTEAAFSHCERIAA
jgi:hypothetical protein